MFIANDSTPKANPIASSTVYRHCKRTQWGLAALVWERDGKRSYRFEDGSERVFSEGFYHLLEPRPAVGEVAEKLLASVRRDATQDRAGAKSGATPRKPTLTLEELVAVFHELYPQGFGDPRWVQTHRGDDGVRRAKRHRIAALADAERQLDRAALDELLQQGHGVEVLARAQAVLAATDLVTSNQIQPLRAAEPSPRLAEALRDLMHEPDADGICFDRACARLARASGAAPSWPLLTGLRTLARPHDDVCIRPSVFFTAISVVSPHRSTRKASPQGKLYQQLAALARELRDRLREAGQEPRDMLDVHDFLWETCRPSAAPLLERVRLRAAEPTPTPPTEDVAEGAADDEDQAEAA